VCEELKVECLILFGERHPARYLLLVRKLKHPASQEQNLNRIKYPYEMTVIISREHYIGRCETLL
ncbi:unnamed protein product, partial [Ectocarpus fasciculatus]